MRKLFSTRKQLLQLLSCLFLFLFCSNKNFGQQNLVPNYSFEQYTICPDNSTIPKVRKSRPDFWYKPDIENATYLNICTNNQPTDGIPYSIFGGGVNYQWPKTGNGYFIMFYLNQNANSYIQIKLYDSLEVGKKYYAEYYVNLANTYIKGCNNIAMLFTQQPVYADTTNYPNLLQANPQITSYGNPMVTDTMGWVKISGIFTAQGGEQYLTLGNFKLASQTQYKQIAPFGTGYNGSVYYVDDVAVYNLDSFCLKADAGRDTTINIGDSVFIGSYTNGIDTIRWLNQTTNAVIDSLRPGFWVKPTTTTSYTVCQQVNGCATCDTVTVNVTIVPLKFISYTCVSSLQGTKPSVENVWQTANEVNVSHFNIQRSTNGKDFITIGKVKANNKTYNEYSFTDDLLTNDLLTLYYRIAAVDFDGKMTYSEVRSISPYVGGGFSVYPNPVTTGNIVITLPTTKANDAFAWQVTITDIYGKTVSQQLLHNKINKLQLHIPKGVYMATVVNKNSATVLTQKIVVL